MLSAKETLQKEPLVKKDGLKGGGYYVEYRTDDARLTIEVMKEAVKFGAEPVNYSKVKELLYEKGKAVGVLIEDFAFFMNQRTQPRPAGFDVIRSDIQFREHVID